MTAPAEYPPDLDLETADDLLSGTLPWIDVPEGYEGISSLVSAVHRGVAPLESGWGSPTVAAMSLRISTTQVNATSGRKHRTGTARKVRHLAAAVAALAVVSSGSAMAAAGGLPSPMQVAVSDVASIVGVSVPSSNDPDRPASPSRHPAAQAPSNGRTRAPSTVATRPGAGATATSPPSTTAQVTTVPTDEPVSSTPTATPGTTPPGPYEPPSATTAVSTPSTGLPRTTGPTQTPQNHGSPPGSNSGRGVGPGAQGSHGAAG